jgi:transposase
MLTVEQIEAIRRAYFVEDKSVRAIARGLHHGRRVIREAIAGTHPQPRRYQLSKAKPRPVLEPVVAIIDAWLEADRSAPRKQRHTAKRIFDRLVAEHDYRGCESIIRQYVHDWKQAHQAASVSFLPLAYAPGSEAQCDWGEGVVRVGGLEQVAQLFCLRLCYSVKAFVMAFPTARQECFLLGHATGFAALGGVPTRVTYDNLGSAVAKVLRGRTRVEQEQFVAFRGHYLFGSHFCLPGQGGAHEKPFAETLVGYARRNFLVPVPEVASWAELNTLLAARCAAEDGRRVAGRAHTIGELWQEERAQLRPLPRQPYPCCRTVAVRATRQGLVTFERNRYSVPSRYAGAQLLLRAAPWEVEVSDGQTVVARHARLYGRDGEQLDPLHYLQVLEHKPGGFDLARPIQHWRTSWPAIYEAYLAALRQARPADATRQFVRILQLLVRFTPEQVAAALTQALALHCWGAEGVELLLRQALEPSAPATSSGWDLATAPGLASLAAVQIPLPDLAQYSQLLPEGMSR